jgi:tryptophan halogenase
MDFMAEEYRARYGANRPRPRVLKTVIDTLSKAPSRLPPHEVWLKRVLGMADYPTRR